MSRFNTLYYLLFVLMVFGAFASMAQNDYGLSILGMVALVFALTFVVQLGQQLKRKDDPDRIWRVIETIGLIIIASVLAMRGFYVRFDYVELLFAVGGLLAGSAYFRKGWRAFAELAQKQGLLAWAVAAFFLSLVLFFASMLMVPFLPSLVEPTGGLAFALLILFGVVSYLRKDFMIDGEKVSPYTWVVNQKGRSILLMSLFLAFSLYMGLTKVDLLPRMYSDQFPQAYFELVNRAETGEERPVEGAYQHEKFKAAYDRFVERSRE